MNPSRNLEIANHVYFAPNSREVIKSLFKGPRTPNGTFQIRSNGILFRTLKGIPFAFLVATAASERFFVTCRRTARGRLRYMSSITARDMRLLGIDGLTQSARSDVSARIWREFTPATT